ncbi:MAG: SDR family NAD(P)-dependent oxidoreductase, partial [Blastocatellia bacterium]|nr:SDR family NAD(P)-dependent oxidoreductase [Blastocatellia bacterium]
MKTVVVTGGNNGLGFEVAKKIATDKRWHVVLACRDSSKATKAVAAIKKKTSNLS